MIKKKEATHTHIHIFAEYNIGNGCVLSVQSCDRFIGWGWQARSFTLWSSSLESFHLVLLGPFLSFMPHNPVTNWLSSSCDEGASSLGRYLWTLPPCWLHPADVSLFHLSSVKWFQQLTELTQQFGRFFKHRSHLKNNPHPPPPKKKREGVCQQSILAYKMR